MSGEADLVMGQMRQRLEDLDRQAANLKSEVEQWQERLDVVERQRKELRDVIDHHEKGSS